jgi:hypothetical protein
MTRSPEQATGNGHDDVPSPEHTDNAPEVVREMVREDRAAHAGDPERAAGTTASADAVESLRRGLRDLKHDVRMLKVGMDKQGQLLQYIATSLERREDDGDAD